MPKPGGGCPGSGGFSATISLDVNILLKHPSTAMQSVQSMDIKA